MLLELRKACKITRLRLVFRELFLALATFPCVYQAIQTRKPEMNSTCISILESFFNHLKTKRSVMYISFVKLGSKYIRKLAQICDYHIFCGYFNPVKAIAIGNWLTTFAICCVYYPINQHYSPYRTQI